MPTPVIKAQNLSGFRSALRRSEPMLWLSGGAFVLALALLGALLLLLASRGLSHFWPQPLVYMQLGLPGGGAHLGIELDREATMPAPGYRSLLHRGGEDYFGSPLLWIDESSVRNRSLPQDALVIVRANQGKIFGFLTSVYREGAWEPPAKDDGGEQARELRELSASFESESSELQSVDRETVLRLRLSSGELAEVAMREVLDVYAPNSMRAVGKVRHFFRALWRFLSQSPRQSNIQGGVFPAIVGTITLVMLMTVIVAPLGVLAAIYLQEYAQRGPVTRLVRIAVNNLAGVPSIVYGVFGLGFFVYAVGGSLDSLLFSERLPAPTLGTPGMLWAALTMALLTLPVVIVATDEGLARVPSSLREGSLALGATRAETLWHVVLPAAAPAVLTGLILAVARATGEVAPLLLVGVAKYAPGLPVSGEFPFLHLDRQFMHLGFYIYDLGFQSPHLETAEGLVFATALLLVLIVVLLNIAAVMLRGRLRNAFRVEDVL